MYDCTFGRMQAPFFLWNLAVVIVYTVSLVQLSGMQVCMEAGDELGARAAASLPACPPARVAGSELLRCWIRARILPACPS